MSGSTIGGFVGGAIGFVVGGPFGAQVGFMVGSLAGSIIDPQTIQGAKWNNQTIQGSHDGLGRAVVLGTATVVGNLLDSEPKPRIGTKTERQGKGGPEVERDTAILTYAIEICDSSELRGTSVEAVIAVWEDERLVYDLRPGAKVSAADSAKWKANKTFYYGREDQSPPSELVAIHGVGNVPAYRGTCLMAVLDEDLMVDIKDNPRGRMPTYRFLVSMCGVSAGRDTPLNHILITGSEAEVDGPVFAMAEAVDVPVPVGIPTSTGATLDGATATYGDGTWVAATKTGTRHLAGTLSTSATWSTGTLSATNDIEFVEYGGTEWAAKERGATGGTTQAFDGDPSAFASASPTTYDTLGNVLTTRFQMLRYINGYWYGSLLRSLHRSTTMAGPFNAVWDGYKNTAAGWDNNGACIIGFYDGVQVGERTYFIVEWHFNVGLQRHRIWWSPDGGVTMSEANIEYDAAYATAGYKPVQLIEVGGKVVALCDDFGVLTNASGTFARVETGMPLFPATGGAQDVDQWSSRRIATDGSRVYIVGGGYMVVSLDKGLTWGDPIALPISSAKGIAVSNITDFTGIELPDSPGHYIDPETGALDGPTLGEAMTCDIPLDQVVRTIWALGAPQLTDDDFDLDALADDTVRGYVVQDPNLNAADACEPLRKVWTFDLPSYDLKIRARKRGGAVDFTVNDADLVVGENETERSLRGQTVEYPKKLHVGYNDPHLDYKPTTQISERYSASLYVFGEEAFDSLLVLSADEAKQAAEKMLKVLWTELEDNRSFSLPLEYLKAAPADLFTYNNRRYRVEQMRIEGQRIVIESAMYDRASAYTSNAAGTQGQAPPSPGTSLRGPTDALLMNAPVLADANDKPGVTWAAAGYPGMNWRGAVLQVQRGSEWVDIGQISQACGVGTLLADLPAFDGTFDTANTLQLRANEDIDGITFAALLAEGNPLAILRPDGRTEILQAQLATETSPGVYDCTNLVRGRLDTANATHLAGARVAILDSRIGFAQLRKDDLGKTLTFRAVSIGTDPDAAPTQTLTLTTMESQREWQPWNVQVEVTETCEHRVTFVGRHRLGTDLNPVQSQWFKGWRIDFTLNGVTHSRMTQEESFLYTREMQVEDWGVALCASYDVAVYAVNEYTGTDGAGNPPGTSDDEPYATAGNLPDGYVGSAYRIFHRDAGFELTGKQPYIQSNVFGLVVPGVTAHGRQPFSETFTTRGWALSAGTYTTNVTAENVGAIAQSVTIAAKPTYSLLDMRWRGWAEGRWADTTPPLTTQVYEADQGTGTGSMWTLGALDSSASNTHVEFVITGAPVYIGINANRPAELTDSAFFSGIVYAGANTAAYLAAAGTYAIELVPSTGAWEIIKLGTGVVASGTLALPSGNRYRFGYTVPAPQDSTVYFNAGNEAWAVTATGGFGGMAHPSVVVPVMWLDTSPANSVTFGTFGKSSGQWRVQVGGRYRSGLAASGFDEANGLPGDAGADDSIVFDGSTLRWTFGGVADFVDLVWPPSAEPAPVYAIDFAASTVKVCRVDYASGVVSVVHTISGLPAGTWLPFDCRGWLSKQIKHNPAGPAGYSDWTTTL